MRMDESEMVKKHTIKTTVHAAIIFIGWISIPLTLEAYDAHHPDPMSILNGHVSHSSNGRLSYPKPIVNRMPKEVMHAGGRQPQRMYRRRKESRYVIKPEPYSIGSKQSDPELLGPQRTLQVSKTTITSDATKAVAVTSPTHDAFKIADARMTRDACIGMIGKEKFEVYVQKYGGEKGAIRRCLILKRLR